jgi:hypothetical protein
LDEKGPAGLFSMIEESLEPAMVAEWTPRRH